jgi:signal transduction histidine kinase
MLVGEKAARLRRVVGLGRSLAAIVVGVIAPLIWSAVAIVAYWWRGDPWSWISLALAGIAATAAMSRPVAGLTRFLVLRWTGADLRPTRRTGMEPTRMATGQWWNGYSYERSRQKAEEDQRWRIWLEDPATWRDLRWIMIAPAVAGLPALVAPAAVVGALLAFVYGGIPGAVLGVALIVLMVLTAPYGWRALPAAARRWLRPAAARELDERTQKLLAQRAEQTAAQAAELRRIERDLHDGAQARLVAAGLSLTIAERLLRTDPDQAQALLRDARDGMSTSLAELRDIVRGIAPPVLTERGPAEAIRALALDLRIPAQVESTLVGRLDVAIESALYFAVVELLTNAVKHGKPSTVQVRLDRVGDEIVAEVEDDGHGGATMRPGGGLAGIVRRLEAFDATLTLSSPTGGPTRARIVLPCAL